MEQQGYQLANAELIMVPKNTVPVPDDKKDQFTHMIEQLEDDDDVSAVYTAAANFEN